MLGIEENLTDRARRELRLRKKQIDMIKTNSKKLIAQAESLTGGQEAGGS